MDLANSGSLAFVTALYLRAANARIMHVCDGTRAVASAVRWWAVCLERQPAQSDHNKKPLPKVD